jgi:hypothetical protein
MYGFSSTLKILEAFANLTCLQTSSKPYKVKPQPESGYISLYTEDGKSGSYILEGYNWLTMR